MLSVPCGQQREMSVAYHECYRPDDRRRSWRGYLELNHEGSRRSVGEMRRFGSAKRAASAAAVQTQCHYQRKDHHNRQAANAPHTLFVSEVAEKREDAERK